MPTHTKAEKAKNKRKVAKKKVAMGLRLKGTKASDKKKRVQRANA